MVTKHVHQSGNDTIGGRQVLLCLVRFGNCIAVPEDRERSIQQIQGVLFVLHMTRQGSKPVWHPSFPFTRIDTTVPVLFQRCLRLFLLLCRCGHFINSHGFHHAACLRTGVLGRRGFASEVGALLPMMWIWSCVWKEHSLSGRMRTTGGSRCSWQGIGPDQNHDSFDACAKAKVVCCFVVAFQVVEFLSFLAFLCKKVFVHTFTQPRGRTIIFSLEKVFFPTDFLRVLFKCRSNYSYDG